MNVNCNFEKKINNHDDNINIPTMIALFFEKVQNISSVVIFNCENYTIKINNK